MTTHLRETATEPLVALDEFFELRPGYLYTGAHSPALGVVENAMVTAYRAKSLGSAGREYLDDQEQVAKRAIADLLHTTPQRVGFLGDASTAWSAVANGWSWKPGDNIVLNEYEHPAVFAPFLRLREQGLEVRIVPKNDDWDLPAQSIKDACDERTIAIGLSHVGYTTGLRHDLDDLGSFAKAEGIPFLVDVSHSLGVVDIDLTYAAITVSASYKWSLGPYGVGIIVWNDELLPDFRPGAVGWRSLQDIFTDTRFDELNWHTDATRFQIGMPALAEISGLAASVGRLLEIGGAVVEDHALTLVGAARSQLVERGLDVITPSDPARYAGNLAFLHPEGEAVAKHLLTHHDVKVWGGDGRVRASFHVMNDLADVEVFTSALDATLPLFERISK
jgi:cysteine desulfurase/selenocysteine lyase